MYTPGLGTVHKLPDRLSGTPGPSESRAEPEVNAARSSWLMRVAPGRWPFAGLKVPRATSTDYGAAARARGWPMEELRPCEPAPGPGAPPVAPHAAAAATLECGRPAHLMPKGRVRSGQGPEVRIGYCIYPSSATMRFSAMGKA